MLELACNNGSSSDSSDSSDTEIGIYDGLSPEEALVLQEQKQKKWKAKNQCCYYWWHQSERQEKARLWALGKSLKLLQIVFIIKLSEHGILYAICPIQVSPSIPNRPVPPTPLVMPLTIQANPSVLVHSFIMIFQVTLITFNTCCSQQRCHGVLSIIGPLALKGGGKRWLRRVMLSMQYLRARL